MTRLTVYCAILVLSLLACHRAAAESAALAAREYLASIRPSAKLQTFLDHTLEELRARDPKLNRVQLYIALIDLSQGKAPSLAHYRGEIPVYPASVVKFVYLMAAYKWQEQGTLRIDPELDTQLSEMIRHSSNLATQRVFARLTGTAPGPELPLDAYRSFRDRRLLVKDWLQTLGIGDLHCVNPTYNGDGDLFGRDKQFLSDHHVSGGLPSRDGEFANRQAMTAVGTAKLLALLATDRALSPSDSETVRHRMRRDPKEQPYLAPRIAGGAARSPDLEVYAKSGTWGPIYADAGVVRHASGRQLIIVVYTEGSPPYRGNFIADLTDRAVQHLLVRP